mmetsp:Transcript_14726/g.39654  ORF Transcript_14726/g.39654 Transcript_14726/m.39654 type:complete len:294 (+) Transcript_14726:530-1411(+)
MWTPPSLGAPFPSRCTWIRPTPTMWTAATPPWQACPRSWPASTRPTTLQSSSGHYAASSRRACPVGMEDRPRLRKRERRARARARRVSHDVWPGFVSRISRSSMQRSPIVAVRWPLSCRGRRVWRQRRVTGIARGRTQSCVHRLHPAAMVRIPNYGPPGVRQGLPTPALPLPVPPARWSWLPCAGQSPGAAPAQPQGLVTAQPRPRTWGAGPEAAKTVCQGHMPSPTQRGVEPTPPASGGFPDARFPIPRARRRRPRPRGELPAPVPTTHQPPFCVLRSVNQWQCAVAEQCEL